MRLLRRLNAAVAIDELRGPPSNRLEQLSGCKLSEHSVRVNKQWQITFYWGSAGPELVNIEDYH